MSPQKRQCTSGCRPCSPAIKACGCVRRLQHFDFLYPARSWALHWRLAVGALLLDEVLALFSGVILICFIGAVIGGAAAALYLLPASGLFMSVIYPSINSKGISCFPKSEHGAVAGVILFFTCLSAVLGRWQWEQ